MCSRVRQVDWLYVLDERIYVACPTFRRQSKISGPLSSSITSRDSGGLKALVDCIESALSAILSSSLYRVVPNENRRRSIIADGMSAQCNAVIVGETG